MREIRRYRTVDGKIPYWEWLEGLDEGIQGRISAYVDRVAAGGAKKNVKPVGDGVFEITIDTGSGYRVYFGQVGGTMLLLLIGGDKSTQIRDIRQAKEFWRDYASR